MAPVPAVEGDMAAWWMVVAALAGPPTPCEKAGAVKASDPVSGESLTQVRVEMERRLGARSMVQHAWSLLARADDVVLVTQAWVRGKQEVVLPAAWPIEVSVEGGRPITLRARTLVVPRFVDGATPYTEFESRFRLDAITSRWMAERPPWRVDAVWGEVHEAYGLKGGAQVKVSRMMACAATLAPESLPELRGVIGELAE